MAITKGDIVTDAYTELRIFGLTSNPTPSENQWALNKLESMAHEFEARNICTGYNFTEEPDLADLANIQFFALQCYVTSLAVRLVTKFGKNVPQALMMQSRQALSSLSSTVALVRPIQQPYRMPRGSGSTLRGNRWQRFYRPPIEAPLECSTNNLIVGDVNDYFEDWTEYLNSGEDISSYTITSNNGVSIESDSLESPRVLFRAKGNELPLNINGLVQNFGIVVITVTTSDGRINTREINFRLIPNTTL